MTPSLYVGLVLHRRLRPTPHNLKYAVYMLHSDLDRLDELGRASRLLSVNRWNRVSFREVDHGPAGEGTLAERIRHLADERGLAWDGAGLTLIACRACGDSSSIRSASIFAATPTGGWRR